MNAEPVILQHRRRNLLRRSDQAGRIAGGAGGARDPHPQPLVMDVAACGVAEQAFGGMVGRLRRSAGLALDIRQQGVGLVPRRAFGFRHDRPQRHVEAGAAPEG